MDWEIKKRGCVTYYTKKTNKLFSDLVVEELDNGNLKIRFVGMTGAHAGTNELGLEDLASMDPAREIPRELAAHSPGLPRGAGSVRLRCDERHSSHHAGHRRDSRHWSRCCARPAGPRRSRARGVEELAGAGARA